MAVNSQSSLLEVLKKKMRAMKDDLESQQELAEERMQKLLQELRRREEVSLCPLVIYLETFPFNLSTLCAVVI